MKLCRYGKNGFEKPGMIDAQGNIRDLSAVVEQIDQGTISPAGLAKLRKIKAETLPLVKGEPRLGVPYVGISKFVAIGLNYADHAREANMAIPPEPIVFMKATTSITGPNDKVIVPKHSTKLDWEVELGVVICKKAQYVPEDKALDYVAGYCVVNDVSERAFQLQSSQWDKGKGCDTFGPIGPWLVTTDEIRDPQNLDMWLDVNGRRMQKGQHPHHDFRRGEAGVLLQPVHDAAAGRHHHHRHSARGGHGHQTRPGVPEAGRCHESGHPGPGRAAPGRGRLPGLREAAGSPTSVRGERPGGL